MKTKTIPKILAFACIFALMGSIALVSLTSLKAQKRPVIRPAYRTVSVNPDHELPDSVRALKDTILLLQKEWDDLIARDKHKLQLEKAELSQLKNQGKVLDKTLANLKENKADSVEPEKEVEQVVKTPEPERIEKAPEPAVKKKRKSWIGRIFGFDI